MGALHALDWMQPSSTRTERRPSWLAPPPPKVSEPRKHLSVVPVARLASIAPPSSGRLVSEPTVAAREVEHRDETIRGLSAELEVLRRTAADLAATLATARRHILEASEGELVKLALVIAERVVGGAFDADPTLIASWARDAIAALPSRDVMVVAISSDLAQSVPEAAWAIATNGTHRLEVDAALPPGTCEVRAGVASVEVSAAARIAAVGETIGDIT